MLSLDCNTSSGLPYEDNLYFPHCLAVHQRYHPHNLGRDTCHLFECYAESNEEFDGITLGELPDLEKLFELIIFVHELTKRLKWWPNLCNSYIIPMPILCT